MATYSSGGATIKESGSLKVTSTDTGLARTVDETVSKTVGSGEYALISIVHSTVMEFNSDADGFTGDPESIIATGAFLSNNQLIVGGGKTFKLRSNLDMEYNPHHNWDGYFEVWIDDCRIYKHTLLSWPTTSGDAVAAIQYVIFE